MNLTKELLSGLKAVKERQLVKINRYKIEAHDRNIGLNRMGEYKHKLQKEEDLALLVDAVRYVLGEI